MDSSPLVTPHGYQHSLTGAFDVEAAGECRWDPGAHPENYRLVDEGEVSADLLDFRELGGRAIVDATPIDLGRNPVALQRFSRATGLHVVMGTGYYLEPTHRGYLTPGAEDEQTYLHITEEFEHGVATTGVRPGLIGEIGTSDPPTESELRVLRGAARAARDTGLALCAHVHPWGRGGPLVADVAMTEGLAPERIALLHTTTARPDDLDVLRATGVWLSFDLFGFDHSLLSAGRYPPTDVDSAAIVAQLFADGLEDRVLVSQDVGVRTRLRRHGGWGYGHLLRHVVPLLRMAGLSEADLHKLVVLNPARLLSLADPSAADGTDAATS